MSATEQGNVSADVLAEALTKAISNMGNQKQEVESYKPKKPLGHFEMPLTSEEAGGKRVKEIVRARRKAIMAAVEEAKEHRIKYGIKPKHKYVVWTANVSRDPARRQTDEEGRPIKNLPLIPNSPLEGWKVSLTAHNVGNSHMKKASMINLKRKGKIIVSYALPTLEDLYKQAEKAQASTLKIISGRNTSIVDSSDVERYRDFVAWLDDEIENNLGSWIYEDRIDELSDEKSSLLERIRLLEADNEGLKGDGVPKAEVQLPETQDEETQDSEEEDFESLKEELK